MSLNDKIAQELNHFLKIINYKDSAQPDESLNDEDKKKSISLMRVNASGEVSAQACACLLYTSPSPRDGLLSRMPSSA